MRLTRPTFWSGHNMKSGIIDSKVADKRIEEFRAKVVRPGLTVGQLIDICLREGAKRERNKISSRESD